MSQLSLFNSSNVFNIEANQHFLNSLINWLSENFSNDLENVKIFLPNRRSCRELQKILIKKNQLNLLPEIKSIAEISYQDFFDFLPNSEVQEIIDELIKINPLTKIEALFFLSQEIQKNAVFGDNLDLNSSLKIANNLLKLFEDIDREEIDFSALEQIDDSNLSQHRLVTLEFIKKFFFQIKNSLLKQNKLFETSAQRLVLSKYSEFLENFPAKKKIIIAGSTGSTKIGRNLIKSAAKKNWVVLHGLWPESYEEENHAQFYLNKLLETLPINRQMVQNIENKKLKLSSTTRLEFVKDLMLPSQETHRWQQTKERLFCEVLTKDFQENFSLIEAEDPINEAIIIAAICRKNAQKKQNTAIICNNDQLSNLIVSELNKLNLSFNDSRKFNLKNTAVCQFITLIIQFWLDKQNNIFDPYNFLTLVKNSFFEKKNAEIIAQFEIEVLRQELSDSSFEAIFDKLKDNKTLENFFSEILQIFQENFNLSESENLSSFTKKLVKIIECFSGRDFVSFLNSKTAGEEIFELFNRLKKLENIELQSRGKKENILKIFENIFSQISYFEETNFFADIQILTTIEARLLNFDHVIIAGLNYGDFPEIEEDGWLGRKIKKDLGIDKAAKKIGQNAYDFCNYLGNSRVTISRFKSLDGKLTLPSPFFLKFKTLVTKLEIFLPNQEKILLNSPNENYQELVKFLTKKNAPKPNPQLSVRPKKISFTEFSKLIQNPYEFYAKRILQLRKLKKISYTPSYAEFGSFVHKVLELYLKSGNKPNFYEIFKDFFVSKQAELIWLPKFDAMFDNFLKANEDFSDAKNFLEVTVKTNFSGIEVNGKIDRIVRENSGKFGIIDYKTGRIPSKKSLLAGQDFQLVLAAILLLRNQISSIKFDINNDEISQLIYWKISTNNSAKAKALFKNSQEVSDLTSQVQNKIDKIIEHYFLSENAFEAKKSDEYSDYKHLAREQEWL